MTQPYLDRIDHEGERVFIFIGGDFSHAVLRGPILGPHGSYTDITIGWKTVDALEPSPGEIALAQHALSILGADALTYARVDILTFSSRSGFGSSVSSRAHAVDDRLFRGDAPLYVWAAGASYMLR